MFTKYFFEDETEEFILKLKKESIKYHHRTGSVCPTSSSEIPSQSYNMPLGYKFFHQGGQETCMFSSLAFAVSYKGYNDAAEIISRNIQGSLIFGDPMKFAANLLNNPVQIDRYTCRTTITEPKDFPTILQITVKHAISICGITYLTQNFMNQCN